MAKKEVQPEELPDEPVEEKPDDEEPAEPIPDEEIEEDLDDEPVVEEKSKKKKDSKKRAKLTVLQAAVLETIRERPQRPRAIQTIIRGTGGVEVPRNEIIRSLNELKNKGFVEKVSAKAWQAK
ncbi:MAG: hypothetical protein ACFFD8_04005 [Candidatus Thorarchaeota archaeon]